MSKKTKRESDKKKTTAKRSPATARSKRDSAAGNGPVTLAEAKALAQAKLPKRAIQRRAAAAAATPQTVANERQRLEKERREEFARRTREYKATLSIMKQRGVKGLTPPTAGPPKRRTARAVAAAGMPLQIFAEGDSWFEYPYPFFGGGLIPRLETRLGIPILNLAKAGDEVRFMLGVEEREILVQSLKDGCPAGGDWDVLLFSGGGNDIVGNPMALWIKDYDPAIPPAKLIEEGRFQAALKLVSAGYEDLIALRDSFSPNTHIVFHGYDFAIPDGRGACGYGPWLKPTFDLCNFPNRAAAVEVVKALLQRFADLLLSFQKNHSGVTFINTQGTLAAQTSSWHNELHPSKSGFNKIADVLHKKLKSLFPSRVP